MSKIRELIRLSLENAKKCASSLGLCLARIDNVVGQVAKQLDTILRPGEAAYIHPWYSNIYSKAVMFNATIPSYEPVVVEVFPSGKTYITLPGYNKLVEVSKEELEEMLNLLQHLLGSVRLDTVRAYSMIDPEDILAGYIVEKKISPNTIGYVLVASIYPIEDETIKAFQAWYESCKARGKVEVVKLGDRVAILTDKPCVDMFEYSYPNIILIYDTYPFKRTDEELRKLVMEKIRWELKTRAFFSEEELRKYLEKNYGARRAQQQKIPGTLGEASPAPA